MHTIRIAISMILLSAIQVRGDAPSQPSIPIPALITGEASIAEPLPEPVEGGRSTIAVSTNGFVVAWCDFGGPGSGPMLHSVALDTEGASKHPAGITLTGIDTRAYDVAAFDDGIAALIGTNRGYDTSASLVWYDTSGSGIESSLSVPSGVVGLVGNIDDRLGLLRWNGSGLSIDIFDRHGTLMSTSGLPDTESARRDIRRTAVSDAGFVVYTDEHSAGAGDSDSPRSALRIVSRDGRAHTSPPLPFAPTDSEDVVIGTFGNQTLIVIYSRYDFQGVARAYIADGGGLQSGPVEMPRWWGGAQPEIVADRNGFLVVAPTSRQPFTRIVARRISTAGYGDEETLVTGPGMNWFAVGGRPDAILLVHDERDGTINSTSVLRGMLFPANGGAPNRLTISQRIPDQSILATIGGPARDVIVWMENSHGAAEFKLKASRLDASGRTGDGPGLLVDSLPAGTHTVASGVWTGDSFLLVWTRDGAVVSRRLRDDGSWVDDAPRKLAETAAAIHENPGALQLIRHKDHIILFWNASIDDRPSFAMMRIGDDGVPLDPLPIPLQPAPALYADTASDHENIVVGWSGCVPSDESCASMPLTVATVSPYGLVHDTYVFDTTSRFTFPSIAVAGSTALIAWAQAGEIRGTRMRDGKPLDLHPDGTAPLLDRAARVDIASASGHFIVATSTLDAGIKGVLKLASIEPTESAGEIAPALRPITAALQLPADLGLLPRADGHVCLTYTKLVRTAGTDWGRRAFVRIFGPKPRARAVRR